MFQQVILDEGAAFNRTDLRDSSIDPLDWFKSADFAFKLDAVAQGSSEDLLSF